MKNLSVLTFLIVLASAFVLFQFQAEPDYENSFKSWMEMHGKTYKSAEEERYRFGIYKENLKSIFAHN